MILLIAQPNVVRTNLLNEVLKATNRRVVVQDSFRADVPWPDRPELIIASAQIDDISISDFLGSLEIKDRPSIILDASPSEEHELYRNGAILVTGPAFYPISVARHARSFLNAMSGKPLWLTSKPEPLATGKFTVGKVIVDADRRTLAPIGAPKKAKPIPRLPLDLLALLRETPNKLLTYETITSAVWRKAFTGNNAVIREATSVLRELFNSVGYNIDQHIETLYGQGYVFHPEPEKT